MLLFKNKSPEIVAAIDLGSNSFHMIVARLSDGDIKVIDKLREMVRLSAGLGQDRLITDDAKQRAIECLEKFAQRLAGFPIDAVRIVGTNTLRSASNSAAFIQQAEQILQHHIEVISGIEEARLIYLGVAHNIAADSSKRLVIDIGGGSTEVIIGEDFAPLCMESLYMGCVSSTQKYFPEGKITASYLKKAIIGARVELAPIAKLYKRVGWSTAIGASGTVRAIRKVVKENGWCEHGITRAALKKLLRAIEGFSHVDDLELKGLSSERKAVLPGGVAILYGIFKQLNIDYLDVSDGALREGLLHELVGRIHHEDVRGRSVLNLAKRYHADLEQASRIEQTGRNCVNLISDAWGFDTYNAMQWITWASQLHEIGLNIAHSHFHKHGAYIVENADMSGFTQQEQKILALMVKNHRRKIPQPTLKFLDKSDAQFILRITVLFRLCVVLHRSRSKKPLPKFNLTANNKNLTITFDHDWLKDHPLTKADLEQEADYLQQIDYELVVEC